VWAAEAPPATGSPVSAALSANGRLLAVGDNWGVITLWRFDEPGKPAQREELEAGLYDVRTVDLSQSGDLLGAGGLEAAAWVTQVWDLKGKRRTASFKLPGEVDHVELAPGGGLLLSKYHLAGERPGLVLFEARRPENPLRVPAPEGWEGWITDLVTAPDSRTFGTFAGEAAKFWRIEPEGPALRSLGEVDFAKLGGAAVFLSPDWKYVELSRRDARIEVRRFAIGEEGPELGEAEVLDAPEGREMICDFSPDSRLLAGVVLKGDEARLWAREDGRTPEWREAARFALPIRPTEVELFPDGRLVLFYTSYAQTAVLFDTRRRRIVSTQELGLQWAFFAFTPDSRHVIAIERSGSGSGSLAVFRLEEAGDGFRLEEMARIRAHRTQVASLAMLADGRRLVTGAADGSAKLWDIVITSDAVLPVGLFEYRPGAQSVLSARCVGATPDGEYLITTGSRPGSPGEVFLWHPGAVHLRGRGP
jgi:hypothetical protein